MLLMPSQQVVNISVDVLVEGTGDGEKRLKETLNGSLAGKHMRGPHDAHDEHMVPEGGTRYPTDLEPLGYSRTRVW